MPVADQLVGVAVVPLKVTVLLPFVAPRFAPLIVIGVPIGPLAGERAAIEGVIDAVAETVTLLKMPVAAVDALWLVTARPAYTWTGIVAVVLLIKFHAMPSAES